jgi:hypothetical protein
MEADSMKTADATFEFPVALKAELQEALDDLENGVRRPEKIKSAREHMDRVREENRRLFGETDIAVELIRQARDRA